MTSSYIGKIDKARKYAEEPGRVNIHTFEASFVGNHKHLPGVVPQRRVALRVRVFRYPRGVQPHHGLAAYAR